MNKRIFYRTINDTFYYPPDNDDDDAHLKKITTRGVTKSNPTQKCRPATGISKKVNIQITKHTDITKQPNNK
jgi:hypothetical protein